MYNLIIQKISQKGIWYDQMKQFAPAYLQIYETLRNDIMAGAYACGTKLPSKRSLADRFRVSVITVEHAYALLTEEGYIQPRQRSGYFVTYRESAGASVPEQPPLRHHHRERPAVDFPFSVYARTMRRVLSEYGEEILVKSPNLGCWELREALAGYLQRSRHITVKPEQIVIGSGAEYLYGLIVQLLDETVYGIEDPSYEKIQQVYEANHVTCRLLPLGRDGVESAALDATDAKVLHITPYRSFPSGVTASAAKKREYLRWAKKTGGRIIEDDFESEFTLSRKPEETVFSLDDGETVIYLNTFSRTIAPSVRVGYMVLPPRLLAAFEEKLGFYSCTVPAYEQYVLADFIAAGDFERHLSRIRRKNRKG